MWQYNYSNELYHYGILGMKWGHRKTKPVETGDFYKESNKVIRTNADGSKTVPAGFVFNRVGKASLDVNKAGALYVSHGKADAARYIKSLGPTPIGKLLGRTGDSVQHIRVKKNLKMASDSETAKETAKLLLSDKQLLKNFNGTLYSYVVTNSFDKGVSNEYLEKAIKKPSGKDAQKLAYGVNSFLADENFLKESKIVYQHFRNNGYDAIPDVHDILSGTSKTAMIIINPDKVEVTSTTAITKEVMKSGKKYVKKLDKLKISDLIT